MKKQYNLNQKPQNIGTFLINQQQLFNVSWDFSLLSLLFNKYYGLSTLQVRWPGHEANHSTKSSE